MKTLTITEARKNLSKWLQAAAQGEDIGIVSGADIIALRKVGVEPTDYAWRDYGLTSEEVVHYEQAAVAEHERLRKAGELEYLTAEKIRKTGAKAVGH
jgi:antitoxin (DNA-binding transcriptional repressor) of toxin-antitoxin stability system